jgi:hypothetical protein
LLAGDKAGTGDSQLIDGNGEAEGPKNSERNFLLPEVMLNWQINVMHLLRSHQVRESYQVGYIRGEGFGRMVQEF